MEEDREADTDTEERGDRGIRPDKKWGAGGKEEDQRGNEKGEENTGRKTEKHGGLVSASPRGGPSPSAACHPCPSSTTREREGVRRFPTGAEVRALCVVQREPEGLSQVKAAVRGQGGAISVFSAVRDSQWGRRQLAYGRCSGNEG